ncbi:hypothetical protein [Mycolicibacterium mageritense]|uniref:Uncharacterized protein n=1 Tax=Mycolicibacterium mageritense TaxID=53462 RepID=A0AAI8XQW0_MYCME|nr:hypothetical protein [Mycolicibacterium mageritense]BDY31422.1 hypothetical protein hbim_05374 [Mycolicibacterium mageritense]
MADDLEKRIRANRRRHTAASGRVEQLDAELSAMVKEALETKSHTWQEIAELLGRVAGREPLSKQRVYQIKEGRR